MDVRCLTCGTKGRKIECPNLGDSSVEPRPGEFVYEVWPGGRWSVQCGSCGDCWSALDIDSQHRAEGYSLENLLRAQGMGGAAEELAAIRKELACEKARLEWMFDGYVVGSGQSRRTLHAHVDGGFAALDWDVVPGEWWGDSFRQAIDKAIAASKG